MQPRMKSPAFVVEGAMAALQALGAAVHQGGVPLRTIELVHLRTSQINGCSVCVDIHSRSLKHMNETPERLAAVAVWREAPYFDEAERAALALAEALTRLVDRPEAVTDAIWAEARRHYEEPALAALVLAIAANNMWNRLNAATRQVSGAWTEGLAA